MSDIMHWISRYCGILVVLAGIVFWAGRLDMKIESLDEKVDLVLQILLDVDNSQEASKIAQQLGAAD